MLNWLKEVITKFTKSKIASFLVEVFSGVTGEVINEHYKIVNEYVKNVESIEAFVNRVDNRIDLDRNKLVLIQQIEEIYGIKLGLDELCELGYGGGIGKYKVAFALIRDRIASENEDASKRDYCQGINLAIEFAVNRYFGK